MVAATEFPALTDEEVELLLGMCRVEDVNRNPPDALASWEPSTAYVVGDEVVPDVRNGHKYRVTSGTGDSGATAPVWPTVSGGTVSDAGLTWTEVGRVYWEPTYNLNIGAAEGWLWKAGKVANRHDFSQEFRNLNRSQMYKQFMETSQRYRNRIVGSIQTRGVTSVGYDPIIGNINV